MNNLSPKKVKMSTLSKLLSTATIVILTGVSNSNAQLVLEHNPLDLVDIPLFLQGSADPAIAVSFDTTPDTRNAYVFFNDTLGGLNSVPGKKKLLASPDINIIYYNPENEYPPPLFEDGTAFTQHPFTNSCRDGYKEEFEANYNECGINLSTSFAPILHDQSNGGYNENGGGRATPSHAFYNRYIGPKYKHPTDPSLDRPNYDDITNNINFVKVLIGSPDPDPTIEPVPNQKQNFSNWFSYYITRNRLVRSSATRAFGIMDEGFKVSWQTFKDGFIENNMYPLRGQHRIDFWNWLLNLKVQGSGALNRAMAGAGDLFQQPQTYREDGTGELLSCQQNFHVMLVNDRAVANYDRGEAAIKNELNETDAGNFGNLTSGFNATESKIYIDPEGSTPADSAFSYWAKDLMPSLDNDVPRFLSSLDNAAGVEQELLTGSNWWEDDALFWNDKNDPADWQHMANFIVGLGIRGHLQPDETKHDSRNGAQTDYRSLRKGDKSWRDLPTNGNDGKLKFTDNLWHAAINSRGEFIAATSPQELVDAFTELINHLLTRRTGSSSASTVSANIVTNDTKTFKTGFDATDWSGSVLAQKINIDGTIGETLWDAACNLTGGRCGALGGETVAKFPSTFSARKIFAYDKPTEKTVNFFASSLEAAQIQALNKSRLIINGEATLDELVNYLRGDRSKEERETDGVFRNRRVLLGDVIHSSAVVVRGPSESYVEKYAPGYTQFKSDNKNRKNIVLVGANDGMLHAFDLDNGNELWAFIPSQSLNNMHLLADPDYGHQNFVDASPIIRDIKTSSGWMTVAVGGLRLGGQGYYALNITDPMNPRVLWEFTDDSTGNKGDADMGYSYGDAFISRINNGSTLVPPLNESVDGQWVAFLPNGYNNIIRDGHSGSGTSVLFMVDMETGTKLKEYDTGKGQINRTNGMASPVVSDVPYTLNGDAVFVGDLRGDVYRIDLTKANSNSFPDAEIMIQAIDPYKTPITIPLRLTQRQIFSPNPTDVMVNIGTGKFIEQGDRSSLTDGSQYVAAIFDKGALSSEYPINLLSGDSKMVVQVATDDTSTNTRTITQLPVSKNMHHGWVMELPGEGERVIAKMATRASAYFLIYSSFLPLGGSACATGGASFVSVVDSRTGGSPIDGPVLQDGTVDGVYVENQVFGVTPIGFAGGGGEILIISTDDGAADGGDVTIIIPDFTWRRRSWHRMFTDDDG